MSDGAFCHYCKSKPCRCSETVCADCGKSRCVCRQAGAPALAKQVGGSHYKDMAIQPVEYIHKNGIGFVEGCVIKYVSRWKTKGGVEDLRKAKHFLDLLIEMEDDK